MKRDQWTDPPPDFYYILFERVNPAKNEDRRYCLAWQPTLEGWAMVRVWGRRGGQQQSRAAPFKSLDAAWPEIRKHIRARLRHGYHIVGPKEYTTN